MTLETRTSGSDPTRPPADSSTVARWNGTRAWVALRIAVVSAILPQPHTPWAARTPTARLPPRAAQPHATRPSVPTAAGEAFCELRGVCYDAPSSGRRPFVSARRIISQPCPPLRFGGNRDEAASPARTWCRRSRRARDGRPVDRRPRGSGGHPGAGGRTVRLAALPIHRPSLDVGPHLRPGRLRTQPGHLLRRHRSRRRLEDGQQRHHLRGAAPGPGADGDWRRRRVAVESGSGLGRHRRGEQPPEHVVGTRRLQIGRRRQDLDQHGTPHVAPHQPRAHRPARQQRRLRRGGGQSVGPGWRTRRVQDDRRRQDLETGAEGR